MSCSNKRIDRVRRAMRIDRLDAFFLRDLSNIKWLTDFEKVFDDEPAHSMMIGHNYATLHTDSRYENACKQAAQGTDIAVDAQTRSHASFAAGIIEGYPSVENQDIVLGIEDSIMLSEYRALEEALLKTGQALTLVETRSYLLKLRAIKDSSEVARLKAAQQITDKAFTHIVNFIKPGMTELEVKIELEDYLIRQGSEGLAFPSIVATGTNAANPHAVAGGRTFEQGQAVVMDFGACSQGYCSDMTRTVFIGPPNERLARAYAAIRRANEEVADMLKPGITGVEAQQHAEKVLAEEGFEGAMGHSLGHGVGIDVHELPVLATRNAEALEVGNVVTVEPGIYISDAFGMRLEDFGVITEQGFEVFTQSPHDMVII